MISCASFPLGLELYGETGWTTGRVVNETGDTWSSGHNPTTHAVPAYGLGFMLRKLPPKLYRAKRTYSLAITNSTTDGSWVADYILADWQQPLPERSKDVWLHSGDKAKLTEATEPEDAVCKLLIQLFKEGLLRNE